MIDIQPALPGFAAHRADTLPLRPIREIQEAVSRYFQLPLNEMLSERQSRHVVRPRHIAMYLARELTLHSYPSIGRHFGNRDHTTVMHACRKVEKLVEEDPATFDAVRALLRRLV